MNDVKLHLRNALVDHSYTFSGRRRDIECAPTYERTAVIDTNNDRTAIGNVGDAQSRDEWQSGMSGSQFVGVEFFAARSLRILSLQRSTRVSRMRLADFGIIVLFLVCMMSLQAPVRRGEERFSLDELIWIFAANGTLSTGLQPPRISLSGRPILPTKTVCW